MSTPEANSLVQRYALDEGIEVKLTIDGPRALPSKAYKDVGHIVAELEVFVRNLQKALEPEVPF